MSWWGELLKAYGSYVGGNVGKEYGGALGGGSKGGTDWTSLINTGTSVAGALAKGKEAGRKEKGAADAGAAVFKQNDAAQAERALENRAGIDLQRKQFGNDAQDRDYKNAIRAALLKNFGPIRATRPQGVPDVHFNMPGFGPEGKAAADEMYRRAMESLVKGKPEFDALPPIERTGAPVYQGPGAMENILGGIGVAGAAINNARNTSQSNSILQQILQASQQGGGLAANKGRDQVAGTDSSGGLRSLDQLLKEMADERKGNTADQDSIWG